MGSGTKYLALEEFLMDKTENITLTFIEINEIINDIIGDIELNYISMCPATDTDKNIVHPVEVVDTVDLYHENECRICFEEETWNFAARGNQTLRSSQIRTF